MNTQQITHKPTPLVAYGMFLFPALFLALQFILRGWPGLVMPVMMKNLNVNAADFGQINSAYYVGYAGMQIPIALMLNRFHPRIIGVFAILCGVFSLVFFLTTNFWVALMARGFVGLGSAAAFLGASRVISQWFPRQHYARMVGLSVTIGLLGAFFGGSPVNYLIESFSPTSVAWGISAVVVGWGALIVACLRTPHHCANHSEPLSWADVRTVLAMPTLWIVGGVNLLLVGAFEGFADVWGKEYLHQIGFSSHHAALMVSLMFLGLTLSGVVLPWISQYTGEVAVSSVCGLGLAAIFGSLLASVGGSTPPWILLAGAMFIAGFFSGYQTCLLTMSATLVTPALMGVSVAFINCMNMLGGVFFHIAIGLFMERGWTGLLGPSGEKVYAVTTYAKALAVVPISALVGTVILLVWAWRRRTAAAPS